MKLSIIIPCYNELSRGSGSSSFATRLNLLRLNTEELSDTEVIIVDDCSKDNSVEFINNFISEHYLSNWKCIRLGKNQGKGYALLEGFKLAKGSYICYIDADMSVSPSYIQTAYKMVNNSDICVYGTRFGYYSKIVNNRTLNRKFISKITKLVINILFGLKVSDTQCGFKLFSKSKIENYLSVIYPSRWLLDVELLYIMKIQGVVFKGIDVKWNNLEQESTLNLTNAMSNCIIDLVKILRLKRVFRGIKY